MRISMERLGFFAEKLMDGMAKFGWSQKTTAVRLGCSYEYVRKMIRGESLPAPTLLKKLCLLFRWVWADLLDCSRQESALRAALYTLALLTTSEQKMVVHLMRTCIVEKGRSAA
jgi:ParB-like chromosome segregation protein Spo0J